jgi:hypothetical protein
MRRRVAVRRRAPLADQGAKQTNVIEITGPGAEVLPALIY